MKSHTMIHGHFQILTCFSMADSDVGFIAVNVDISSQFPMKMKLGQVAI